MTEVSCKGGSQVRQIKEREFRDDWWVKHRTSTQNRRKGTCKSFILTIHLNPDDLHQNITEQFWSIIVWFIYRQTSPNMSKHVQTCPNIQPAAASLIGTPLTFDPETCSLHACDGCSQQESIQRSVLRDIHKFTKKLPVLVSFQLFRRQEVKIKHAKFLKLAPNSLHRARVAGPDRSSVSISCITGAEVCFWWEWITAASLCIWSTLNIKHCSQKY